MGMSAQGVGAAAFDHGAWDELVARHVDEGGLVDYQALAQEWPRLDAYLKALEQPNLAAWSREEQLAFWINAYNACVIKGVLDRYPINSVQEVNGFFDRITYQVAGAPRTLNQIEEQGRALGDWRIHLAVVCASSSCPFLRPEAYAPDRLEQQLAAQAKRFLADPSRGLRIDGTKLRLSKIFKWYAKDFVPDGHLTPQALGALLAPYLTADASRQLAGADAITYMDYQWTLNDQAL